MHIVHIGIDSDLPRIIQNKKSVMLQPNSTMYFSGILCESLNHVVFINTNLSVGCIFSQPHLKVCKITFNFNYHCKSFDIPTHKTLAFAQSSLTQTAQAQ